MLLFEWDPAKARSNRAKHGVTFEEATTIFGDTHSLTIDDPAHSLVEHRFITIGQSHSGRILVVVHTARSGKIRLISARPCSRQEKFHYENV